MIVKETKLQSKQEGHGKRASQPNTLFDLIGTILMLLVIAGLMIELLYLYIS